MYQMESRVNGSWQGESIHRTTMVDNGNCSRSLERKHFITCFSTLKSVDEIGLRQNLYIHNHEWGIFHTGVQHIVVCLSAWAFQSESSNIQIWIDVRRGIFFKTLALLSMVTNSEDGGMTICKLINSLKYNIHQ